MTNRGKIWLSTIVILLVAATAGLFDVPVPGSFPGASFWNALPFRLGLDLQGGAHLVYEADTSNIAASDRDSAVEGTRDVIERRVNALGVSEPLVQTNKPADGDYRVIVELAGVFDINEAIAQIGETPLLEFKEVQNSNTTSTEPIFINTKLTGKNLKRASLDFDQSLGDPLVALEFDSEGGRLFQDITKRNIGRPVAIFLDGEAISVPVVQQEISGGRAVITGQFNVKEAKELAARLNAGALPVPIELISQQTVGPSLGKMSVENSLRAGLIGLLLVALFMVMYYRLPGLVSVLALGVYITLVLLFFQLLNVTLTLAGIAGFILTIGMAVDANVLIFERMKEELRSGKKLDAAIDLGFKRAWTSIRDANISSLITAVILYWFGTSFIRGFAITFAIGILLSMFSAVVVTKTFLKLMEHFEAKHLLFGVRPFKPSDSSTN